MATILFTGYPGFLGSALLPLALARRPDHDAVCLIQSHFLPVAQRRLAEQEAEHPHLIDRVRLAPGDITQADLGLRPEDTQGVSEVFHLAAVYDLAVGAEVARKVNVLGTDNVLDLCRALPELERLHYVSTCYVSGRYPGVYLEDELDAGQVHQNFYEETKYQAEVLVRRAMAEGLPASIYRPGIVVGDSATGATQKYDGPYYLARLLKIQPRVAVVPRFGNPEEIVFSMVPRDYVIAGIDALSAMDAAVGKTYALTDPAAPTVRHLVETFAALEDREVTWLPVPVRLGRGLVGLPGVENLLKIPEETLDYFAFPTRYDTTNARTDLGAVGIHCPSFDEYAPNLIRFYLDNPEISSAAMV